jgi:DNA primase
LISPDTIERIRERATISIIIGESIKLTRRGRSHLGLCPFHKERTPSFHVNDERGHYHCFGCQASGDVFRFLQEQEGLTFMEAVQKLGERFGIEVKDDLTEAERRERAAKKRADDAHYLITELAASYFEDMLQRHPQRHYALDELKKRGLDFAGQDQVVLKSFRIGYAPDSWDSLSEYLRKKGADLRSAEAVGLVGQRKGGGYYDRFRHRLMFGVIDLNGRVIAFSGRALPPTSPPADGAEEPAKYYNSPESPIYKKRDTVFGLYQARSALRSGMPCILVEGNFDVMSLHARGVTAAVAPLGTAFTEEQGRLIRRFTQDVVLLFDGDSAGKKATVASREPCQAAGLSAKVAALPDGSDPDDFIRSQGQAALETLLSRAKGMLDYLISRVLDERFITADAESRARKIDSVLRLLQTETDTNVRLMAEQYADQLASALASRLGVVDARTFGALVAGVRRAAQGSLPAAGRSAPLAPPARAQSRGRVHEMDLAIIGALLDYPTLLDSEEVLAYSEVMQGDLALGVVGLRRALRQNGSNSPQPGDASNSATELILSKLPESFRAFASERLAAPLHANWEDAKRELVGNLEKLHRIHLDRLGETTLSELEKARQTGNFDDELLLLKEQEQLARARLGIK